MKKFFTFLIAFVLFSNVCYALEDAPICVIVNGRAISSDVPAQLVEGRTLLPVRAIFEALGMVVSWNADKRLVTGSGYDYLVTLTIDQPEIRFYLDEEITEDSQYTEIIADVPPQIIDGRTMVPVRALAEALDSKVSWDDAARTVTIEQSIFPERTSGGGYCIDGNDARFIGRFYKKDGLLWSSFSASGIELRFSGTSARLLLNITGGADAYFHVFIDGESEEVNPNYQVEDTRLMVPRGENQSLVLAENLPNGIHTVKLVKANEEQYNQVGYVAFYTDGELLAPAPTTKTRKIQVFGDSITCAACNVNLPENTIKEANGSLYQDSLTSYASFIGRYFDADMEFFSRSGMSAWTVFNSSVADPAYGHVSLAYPQYGTWNHARFEPDLILQFNWINEVIGKIERDGLDPQEIQSVYVRMLKAFKSAHPNAKIILVSNRSRPNFTTLTKAAIAEYAKTADDDADIMIFESNIPYPRHPLAETHQKIAEELEPVIAAFMGW